MLLHELKNYKEKSHHNTLVIGLQGTHLSENIQKIGIADNTMHQGHPASIATIADTSILLGFGHVVKNDF